MKPFLCRQGGNGRDLFPLHCPFCGDEEAPEALATYAKIDLDSQRLPVEEAVRRFEQAIGQSEAAGLKWLIVLHGYGSSGAGGRLRAELRQGLAANFWANRIWDSVGGEAVSRRSDLDAALGSEQRELFRIMERERLLGNAGATILVLRRLTA